MEKSRLFYSNLFIFSFVLVLFCLLSCKDKSNDISDACQLYDITSSDSDGDGLSDTSEKEGWDVIITQTDGSTKLYHVKSNHRKADTNGDGICDKKERMYSIDPQKIDTDKDGLSDFDELTLWSSDPRNKDTDGDSKGNPLLFDGSEVSNYYTSPVMKDSDGDGLSDHFEITQMSERFNPLIANVPEVTTTIIGTTNLQLNYKINNKKVSENQTSVDLEQSQSNEYSTTDSRTHEVTAELSSSLSAKAEASGFPPGASVSAEASVTASAGYSYTNNKTVSESSAKQSRSLYGKVSKASTENSFESEDADLKVAFEVINSGPVSYTIKDMTVIAILRNPKNPTLFKPIAELTIGESSNAPAELSLSPSSKSNKLAFSVKISHDSATELLKNPEMLYFEVSRLELFRKIQETDRIINEVFLEEVTSASTAQIVIDYGNGHVIQERVATNTMRTNGEVRGTKLSHILKNILGIDFSTKKQSNSNDAQAVKTLHHLVDKVNDTKIENKKEVNKFWAVVGSNGLKIDSLQDFEDIIISAGNVIHLIYVKDEDRDGLFAREEYRYGTYDNKKEALANNVTDPKDSDGDGISDFDEVKVGWIQGDLDLGYGNEIIKNVQLFSDPSVKDSDGDGLSDQEEKDLKTDPLKVDTDNDGVIDSKDKSPLVRPTMTAML